MGKKTENSGEEPQVYKKTELESMIELIKAGVWRTNNLAKALHVDINTITTWKKREEVKEAHREAILKFAKKRVDVEKILKELDFESDPEPTSDVNIYMGLTDEQLDKVIASKEAEVGIHPDAGGKEEEDQGESPEVRDTASEAN